MKSVTPGRSISPAEVTNVSAHGFWLLVHERELFVSFRDFPWFREATVREITNVQLPSPHHLRWPDLDVDLAVESIEHPEEYPLVSQVQPDQTLALPELLRPSAVHEITVSADRKLAVPKATPAFLRWRGAPVKDTYGGKVILDYRGRPAFAELAILWSMMDAGWEGVWIDAYRRAYRQGYWDVAPVKLPRRAESLIAGMSERVGRWTGSWDVFCWNKNRSMFLEAKRLSSRDAIRASQVRWMTAGLRLGMDVNDFLIVEWSVRTNRLPSHSPPGESLLRIKRP